MQMVTCTFRFCASASAAAAMVLMAARFSHRLMGNSAALAKINKLRSVIVSLIMRPILTKAALAAWVLVAAVPGQPSADTRLPADFLKAHNKLRAELGLP